MLKIFESMSTLNGAEHRIQRFHKYVQRLACWLSRLQSYSIFFSLAVHFLKMLWIPHMGNFELSSSLATVFDKVEWHRD